MTLRKQLLAGLALCTSLSANAAVLAQPSLDTYSYVFAGTNNDLNATINVSQYNGGGHFTFGLVEYDVSSLSTAGSKHLLMRASGYTDGSQGATPTTSGSYTVNVGLMPAAFSDYLSSPSDAGPPPPGTGKLPWFDSNILPLTPIGTLSFNDQFVSSLDVTTAVNDWISGATDNYGFVFWNTADAGSVQISSDAGAYSPNLNSVPEPETYALMGGIAALGLALYRRRKLSHQ